MSNVALLFYGQPRFVEKGFPFIKQCLIDSLQPKIFFHCWYDSNQIGKPYSAAPWNAGKSDIIKPHLVETLKSLYNPEQRGFLFEPEKFWDNNLPRNYDSNKGMQYSFITFSQNYSKWVVNELKCQYERKNNMIFDWVFVIRYDCAIQSIITLDTLKKLNNDVVYVPNNCPNPTCFNDLMAFGSSKNINIFNSVFPQIDQYWVNDNIKLVGETMSTHHLNVNNVKWQPIQINHDLIRN